MKIIILGYGNSLRKDDGFGVYAAQALASANLPGEVEIITCQQLSPELSVALSQADRAIFIDAALGSADDKPWHFKTRELQPCAMLPGGITHHFAPEMLLALAESLYGHAPQATLFAVTAASFELGEDLSPELALVLPVLVEQVRGYIRTIESF
jgi:hydrogenase maturation protease